MRLSTKDWLQEPAVQQLIRLFTSQGAALRFVGGCVRDALLGRPVHDIDCATPLPPERVIALLEAGGVRAIPTGLAHGTVTAIIEGRPFEITTLRRDVACDGRHAEVSFTDDWQQDAARRDFTMNALYCDAQGTVSDFFGGIADAAAGRVRFIGEAKARITEDALRILRFFRFLATHGKGTPDGDALKACHNQRRLLEGLSGERIQHEMRKLLSAADPLPALQLMAQGSMLPHIAPGMSPSEHAQQLLAELHDKGVAAHPWLHLALTLRAGGGDAATLAARWKLSGADRNLLIALCTAPRNTEDMLSLLYDHGQPLASLLLLRDGSEQAMGAVMLKQRYEALTALERPVFPVGGSDLIALGLAQGRAMGAALNMLEERWRASGFTLEKHALLAFIRR